ncbi:hypothetical protein [Amycolatopsis sp. NPDC049159]|uniref:ATP-grasp domain-containing protein n=1 Tax=Amycolatopsis sp. NPDC049159 TaxID=3157210 RepID=UPI0033DBD272
MAGIKIENLFSPPRTADRGNFVRQVDRAVAEIGGQTIWHSTEWVLEMRFKTNRKFVIGYTFPLNDAASAMLAEDKVATACVLAESGVPCVPHVLIRPGPEGLERVFTRYEPGQEVEDSVLKPNDGCGGHDVYRVRTADELEAALGTLSGKYRALALSPYIAIQDEYRTVFLDGELLLAYSKERASDHTGNGSGTLEWRHNLGLGAAPRLCTGKPELDRLTDLGSRAMNALGLRFATVDIVTDGERDLVLEINGGVALERFSADNAAYFALAGDVYQQAVMASFVH